jgi:tetratricopeptide (TPR) repeat protein
VIKWDRERFRGIVEICYLGNILMRRFGLRQVALAELSHGESEHGMEEDMRRLSLVTLLATAGLLAGTAAFAAGMDPPAAAPTPPPKADGTPPKSDAGATKATPKPDEVKKDEVKKEEKKSFIPTPDWIAAYKQAAGLIKDEKYDAAIAAFKALPSVEASPDALNYLGFAHRKLKLMPTAKAYYEMALALDPTHKGALEYFGEWHAEVGDLDGAKSLLARLEAACGGKNCEEYADLEKAIKVKQAGAARPRG